MRVRDLMTPAPRTCAPESTLADAALAMDQARCGVLPVVDCGRTVGMLTDRDVCLALAREDGRPSEVRVDRAMSRDVHYLKEDETHARALQLMRRWRVRRLPVLAADGSLRGIVTLTCACPTRPRSSSRSCRSRTPPGSTARSAAGRRR